MGNSSKPSSNDEFSRIYRDYYDRIYAFLFKMCRNAQLCEELTQESFYQAFRSFHRYNGSCTLFTWLAAIAKNTYFKYLRHRKNAPAELDGELFSELLRACPSSEPETVMAKKEQKLRVRDALAALPEKYRDVVILRIYGELPYGEIARLLGISESSAKVLFFRAKNTLREVLTDEYEL